MSLTDVFDELDAKRTAMTREERHGASVLILFNEKPTKALGCRLPDGTVTDAVCLTTPSDPSGVVWTRPVASGSPFHRLGRIEVEPGVVVRFIDDSTADIASEAKETAPDLGRDMTGSERLRELARSELFAGLLYAALCNTTWRHVASDQVWHCSWRYAGKLVAGLRGEGSYLDWYCWGHEGELDEQVLLELEALGWQLASVNTVEL
ncbi:MAG: hypothetical protein ACR2QH_06155 [Geminicoccaceae bacterium]